MLTKWFLSTRAVVGGLLIASGSLTLGAVTA
jgi:hypothetical protein